MLQITAVFIIIALTIGIAAYRAYKMFSRSGTEGGSTCAGCSGCPLSGKTAHGKVCEKAKESVKSEK